MKDKSFDTINVVPFIDIMLVLLTIVLATATFIAKGSIPVELPKAAQTESAKQGVTIDVSKEGEYYYNGKSYSIQALSETMNTLDKESPIVLRADRNAVIQNFVDIMNMLKLAGFKNVNLETEKE
ncbi:ExbD/TolR family protein [Seleniivibrio woodruffii]|uniref:Biopolymer transport protein ExbD n=1 Tax=Seleniivibrio woodruffii TaxID=1078050 RepID=A0A4R1KDB8_9BACT|nr:biopolymer transporter ExbD [Seleniivibrio woodruffii]TCK61993.1 biopolymer transport protein ExbD [Seleniivibrio woodruffii]TVZ34890.1 biopolymer transport protein ExbD [Seleniivibrio woodruffii]